MQSRGGIRALAFQYQQEAEMLEEALRQARAILNLPVDELPAPGAEALRQAIEADRLQTTIKRLFPDG